MARMIDYTDQKIGRLTFLSHYKEGVKRFWKVECDCGHQFVMRGDYIPVLRWKGSRFECLPCKNKRRLPIELNSKFGRLTVIKEINSKDGRHRFFLCLCECGEYTELPGTRLISKKQPTRSCGCYARKLHSKWANTTQYPPAHGFRKTGYEKHTKTRLYNVRTRILASCYRKEDPRFSNYGARNCTVCDLWRNGAKEFVKWALSNNYQIGDAVLLKEGKLEFNPSNCIVIPKNEFFKINNSKFIEYNGQKKSMSEWAHELGCSVSGISLRIKKYLKKYGIQKTMDLNWLPERDPQKYGTEHFEPEIVQLYQQGMTYQEITDKIGCSASTIKRFLLKNSIPIRPAKCRSSLNK